ncbi:uncharacterized protein LOC108234398 [Kryptolebias marmoratus]|uniref:uncharacterized protein LOC108234398 n=1 Tax=Kryptolebias marmoratus TaxID=37003 RepID=UPI0007F9191A|nr:uncharacterized protein LOC108234398 [Kryptolebias marmoratus]
MLLGFILVFSLCGSMVKCFSSTIGYTPYIRTPYIRTTTTTVTSTTEERLPALEIVATPDYPVAAGQDVHLNCNSSSISMPVTWSWQHLQDNSWKVVSNGKELTLTKPEESGMYRCQVVSRLNQIRTSQARIIYIVSFKATVGENLGKAAFALSILSLAAIIAGLIWLGWQRFGDKPTALSTPNKSVSGPEIAPKACPPQADCDGDMYMNYTHMDRSYTDLDPANMSGDNLYSTLS